MNVWFIFWLLSLGVSLGVAATLTYQWFAHRPRPFETDDYTARLRALDRRVP